MAYCVASSSLFALMSATKNIQVHETKNKDGQMRRKSRQAKSDKYSINCTYLNAFIITVWEAAVTWPLWKSGHTWFLHLLRCKTSCCKKLFVKSHSWTWTYRVLNLWSRLWRNLITPDLATMRVVLHSCIIPISVIFSVALTKQAKYSALIPFKKPFDYFIC